ncbi:MAG: PEP-CTERM sorting domain-containing protein [Candidatus Hydrogenedentales bacterium]
MKKTVIFVVLALLVSAPGWASFVPVQAIDNITIPDTVASNSGPKGDGAGPNGWWNGVGVGGEDQEVEPNCTHGQAWDLEAFYLDSNNLLTMVGGYDFENGVTSSGWTWEYGDLFIDIDGNAVYGAAAGTGQQGSQPSHSQTTMNVYGYDYVLAFDGALDGDGNPMYTAYKLDAEDATLLVYYNANDHANPWRYDSGGEEVHSGSFQYFTNLPDTDFPTFTDDTFQTLSHLQGGWHNAVQVDLTWLWDEVRQYDPEWGGTVITHFTMECGNDNLMGQGILPYDPGVVIPEPASITLMGLGIAAVAVSRLRKA